jgi:S1-C subfamily serine protease
MKKVLLTACAFIVFAQTFGQSNSDMLERALSSVITVAVYKSELTKQTLGFRGSSDDAYDKSLDLSNASGSGSGFIIEKNGKLYVITNAHVVEDASSDPESIYIFSINRSKYEVKILGGDSFYDIAVLEFVTPPGKEISSLKMRHSEPRIGEQVFAIGNPLGEYPYTVSDGIISAKNRVRGGTTGKFGFLQTTATVIWGNSGGPLVDSKGEVVGINSQIAFAQRSDMTLWQPQINFALESSISNRLIDEIINNNGRVKRAYLGIELSQNYELIFSMQTFESQWVLRDELPVISGFVQGSPAANALADKIGFAVSKVNGVEVRNLEEALGELEKVKPNATLKLTLTRGTAVQEVQVKTMELNAQRLEEQARFLFEADPRIVLASADKMVIIGIKDEKVAQNMNVETSSTENFYIITVGVSEENFNSLWRIEKLSDLGAALRLTGLYGFYDVFLVSEKSPDSRPEKIRISLSGDEEVRKLTLWY